MAKLLGPDFIEPFTLSLRPRHLWLGIGRPYEVVSLKILSGAPQSGIMLVITHISRYCCRIHRLYCN